MVCESVSPGVHWFTPGKEYSGFSDSDGQALHTTDDYGEYALIFIDQSSHGTFKQKKD